MSQAACDAMDSRRFNQLEKPMAYMSQERKKTLAPAIKALMQEYGIKGSLAVDNHSTLVLNLTEGKIDFFASANRIRDAKPPASNYNNGVAKDYLQVNPYWAHEHFDGIAKDFIVKVLAAMNVGNHNRSDMQSDYHDVGWYTEINVGRWTKFYKIQ